MKINSDALSRQLAQALKPCYLISGDETLLVQEAVRTVRTHADQQGFGERCIYPVDSGFDWDQLHAVVANYSLFGDRKFVELRLSSTKIGDQGSQALRDFVAAALSDAILVVVTPKLDAATQRAKWVSAFEERGVHVQVWPVEAARLPQWLSQRARGKKLSLSDETLALLVDKVEGNLLAADQELEKLLLLNGPGQVDEAVAKQSITDSARFSIYTLVDYALYGQPAKVAHVLEGLRAEGVEAVLVLWALTREIRSLLSMRARQDSGTGIESILTEFKVWERRKSLLRAALQRHDSAQWYSMLAECAKIDQQIKGIATGNPWDALLRLSLKLAGRPLFALAVC